jgi:flagellin-like protein
MKGVSPLIAAVMLIAFVVTVSMVVMGWFSTFVRGVTQNVSESGQEAVGCATAAIELDHVYVNTVSNTTQFIVKNIGGITLTVKGLIVNTTGVACINNTGVSVPSGGVETLYFTDCKGINSSTFSRAMITTSCAGIDDTVTSTSKVTFVS